MPTTLRLFARLHHGLRAKKRLTNSRASCSPLQPGPNRLLSTHLKVETLERRRWKRKTLGGV